MAIRTAVARQRPGTRPRAATPPDWRSFPGSVYRPRRPTQTPLYQAVQHHLETFLAWASAADPMGYGVPEWVERDFRAYLECGILAHGFTQARCEDCRHERLIPFSCKGRGICPSCNARRMCGLLQRTEPAGAEGAGHRRVCIAGPRGQGGRGPRSERVSRQGAHG